MNLSTQQHYFLHNINLLWDTSFRKPLLTGVIAENPEAVCVMQEGWCHQPHSYLQEKAVLLFLILSFCKIMRWLGHLILHVVDSTTFRHFYKPKARIPALNLNSSSIASSMSALFPMVLDVAVSRVWPLNTSSSQSKHMWAGTSEVTTPLHFNKIIFPAVLLFSGHCCKCMTGANGICEYVTPVLTWLLDECHSKAAAREDEVERRWGDGGCKCWPIPAPLNLNTGCDP